MRNTDVCIVIPNWNGKDSIVACLESLLSQSLPGHIIVVDNGSRDGSLELIEKKFPTIEIIKKDKNHGFAGGVNFGIRRSLELEAHFIGLLNNDAVADRHWVKELVDKLNHSKKVGIVTGKFLDQSGQYFDSAGDTYTSWGLPYPKARGEKVGTAYNQSQDIFAATGGASMYRAEMFRQIGLFDEDFFAYYEDVDLSFRAQLSGWKVAYVPRAIAYHQIGATSSKIKGFTTYQTMKNLPLLFWKNVPLRLLPAMSLRFKLAYFLFFMSAVKRGQGWYAIKGFLRMLTLFPKKLFQRSNIQKNRKVSNNYIRSILIYDLPPNATKLRHLRRKWWQLIGRKPA